MDIGEVGGQVRWAEGSRSEIEPWGLGLALEGRKFANRRYEGILYQD